MKLPRRAVIAAVLAASCGSETPNPRRVPITPTEPTPSGSSSAVTLSAPVAISPINGEQLSTLRPTLTVANSSSSNQSGTRTYEFQVSDRPDFALGASLTTSFLVAVNLIGVPEGGGGRTSFTVTQDLQPTTRMYWRVRSVQGSTISDWSPVAMFRTKLVGYNLPGQLYDPLVHGETIGTVVGPVTFINGKGAQLNSESAYIRYRLPATIPNGEFSALVENLAPDAPGSKFKIFSMQSGTGNLIDDPFMMDVQYRGGIGGDPDNSISFEARFGSSGGNRKFEPTFVNRRVLLLDPSKTYLWTLHWGAEVRLRVEDAGAAEFAPWIYLHGVDTVGSYTPSPHYAYIGANTAGSGETGSRLGAVIRHVWIGPIGRPDTLGNALE